MPSNTVITGSTIRPDKLENLGLGVSHVDQHEAIAHAIFAVSCNGKGRRLGCLDAGGICK